ncbi:MAG: vanadium-dependent haloperoxidase [Bacteroidota bacterium]|nr:vanadium-dependent haloperoxidase [Bacteroidota bacterium]
MKHSLRALITYKLVISLFLLTAFFSCKKETDNNHFAHQENVTKSGNTYGHLKQTKTYTSEVLQDWIKLNMQLLRTNASKLNNFVMIHHWAYSSIALYEAVVPGMPEYQTLSKQLNEMPSMPETEPGKAYHWPTVANTVMAAMTRYFYMDSITQVGKELIIALEDRLNTLYQQEVDAASFNRSKAFGKEVAERVFKWALTDGYLTIHPSYILPVGPGFWEKTLPGFLSPQRPYWSTNRSLMEGSIAASQIPPPPAFSTDPSSPFYAMAKEVYDISNNLTNEQKEQGYFWRDVPGGAHAHWLNIYLQVLYEQSNRTMLDKAALIYAKMGITQSDARISCWKAKYTYNQLRPVTFINAVIDIEKDWIPLITTPNHPEYPAAHSSFSAPAADVLTREFGDNYAFTDDTYNFISLPARDFNSFHHAALDAGESRILAGIHYRPSVAAGQKLGIAVSKYMYDHIKFKKGS